MDNHRTIHNSVEASEGYLIGDYYDTREEGDHPTPKNPRDSDDEEEICERVLRVSGQVSTCSLSNRPSFSTVVRDLPA